MRNEKTAELFAKRRSTFDQKFVNEEDTPIVPRRINQKYVGGEPSRNIKVGSGNISPEGRGGYESGLDISRTLGVPNNYTGKYLIQSRLPSLTKQIISKPLQYNTRCYAPNTSGSYMLDQNGGSTVRSNGSSWVKDSARR